MLRHWIDELADKLYESFKKRGKNIIVFNSGLSVSGLQHVGRLRGEIIIPEVLKKILQSRGLVVKQYLTLYTQDSWKAKEAQIKRFRENGAKYAGWPLIKVPDPEGCHSNWVEHYWKDFGPFIGEFTDGEIEVVTTTELYKTKLKEFAKLVFENREKVRNVVNKYRGRKPYKEGWIPFEPICEKCGRIDITNSTRIINGEHVEYVCSGCGHRGISSIENGKLMWRIEWVGVWWSLGVDFEAYGKDHAMPGGSRDSCVDLAINVFNMQPPEGIPYEWVEWKTPDGRLVDMGSSDFLGFTPREWLEVAHPHIFRFIVLKTPPMKKFAVGLHEVPHYYNLYYRAERIYYRVERAKSEEEEILLARSYELSYPRGSPPREMPEQVSYLHLAILAQIVPCERWATEGLTRLKTSGHLSEKPTEYGLKRILETMQKARVWVEKYGPGDMRVELLPISEAEKIASTVPSGIVDIFRELYERFQSLDSWSEESIREAFIAVTSRLGEDLVKSFYTYFYRVITGKDSGPRAAPLLALLGRELSLKYILLATKTRD